MGDQISQPEERNTNGRITRPPQRHRFTKAADAVEAFRTAPAVDWQRMRDDLDAVVDPDVAPQA